MATQTDLGLGGSSGPPKTNGWSMTLPRRSRLSSSHQFRKATFQIEILQKSDTTPDQGSEAEQLESTGKRCQSSDCNLYREWAEDRRQGAFRRTHRGISKQCPSGAERMRHRAAGDYQGVNNTHRCPGIDGKVSTNRSDRLNRHSGVPLRLRQSSMNLRSGNCKNSVSKAIVTFCLFHYRSNVQEDAKSSGSKH